MARRTRLRGTGLWSGHLDQGRVLLNAAGRAIGAGLGSAGAQASFTGVARLPTADSAASVSSAMRT